MSNNNTVTVDQYDSLKAKFLTVDRSYESLKALARKGECGLGANARFAASRLSGDIRLPFTAVGEFEGLRARYKELGKTVCDRFGVSVLGPVCGGVHSPHFLPSASDREERA